ncbi:hypothetical protein HN681_04885 [archaeon]|nr:hypothetical protein [archaeon]MBT3730471.1 hypothetical protein [archaeon]MBT4670454.1 hypothetical protein [archaeon]MBT5030079.1 hypothetical protein [archaeon]MBT5288229.1 hypothetical protein [archaeon]
MGIQENYSYEGVFGFYRFLRDRHARSVYENLIGDFQELSDKAYHSENLFEMKDLMRDFLYLRNEYLKNYSDLSKAGFARDLDTLIFNSKMVIADKIDVVRSDEFQRDISAILERDHKQS